MTSAASDDPPGDVGRRRSGPKQDPKRRWGTPTRVVFGFVVLAVVVFALLRAHSASHDFVTAFRHFNAGRLPWLALAVGAEIVSFLCYALVQRRLLRSGGARLTRRTMVSLAIAATGITNIVPGGTAPASGWLVGQYRRRGIPMPLALWVVLAGGFAAAVSILLLLLVGAGIAGLISLWQAIGCAVLGAALATSLVAATHHLPAIERWLDARAGRRWTRPLRKLATSASTVGGFRMTVPAGAHVLALSLANWTMDVFCLMASFEMLGRPVPWHAVLFAYAVAQVAGSLAPVPGGIGFVEGGMVGAFALVGTGTGDALAATIVYRAITCWAVAAVGSLMLLVLSRRRVRIAGTVDQSQVTTDTVGSAPVVERP